MPEAWEVTFHWPKLTLAIPSADRDGNPITRQSAIDIAKSILLDYKGTDAKNITASLVPLDTVNTAMADEGVGGLLPPAPPHATAVVLAEDAIRGALGRATIDLDPSAPDYQIILVSALLNVALRLLPNLPDRYRLVAAMLKELDDSYRLEQAAESNGATVIHSTGELQ